MAYMLPAAADVNDAFVQALATICLSVGAGFDWQSLDDSVMAGLRRAAPMVDQIIDQRWESMSQVAMGGGLLPVSWYGGTPDHARPLSTQSGVVSTAINGLGFGGNWR